MDIMNSICEINLSDAWIYHKAKQSFVSFIRFYCEHDLKYIFDINKLDIASLANLFSLLKIPRVKEILGKKIDFTPISNKDPNAIEYLNKNTEKQMEEKKIKAQEKLNQILLNKKKLRQKDSEGKKKNRTKKQKKSTKIKNNNKEWDEFQEEERLYRKMKNGKLSKEDFDNKFL